MDTPAILLTAAEEDLPPDIDNGTFSPLHLPLERYVPLSDLSRVKESLSESARCDQIAYANLRNARFFIGAVRETGQMEEVKQRVNLAQDPRTAAWLEEQGIPAIHPPAAGKAIDLMEFLLRLRRTGGTLYPCGKETAEELPGLLRELDMPVEELVLFQLEGPGNEKLEEYRQIVSRRQIGAVVFHSRRSVIRTFAAFPELDPETLTVISADSGITEKLKEKGITADREADGSWSSLVELMAQL